MSTPNPPRRGDPQRTTPTTPQDTAPTVPQTAPATPQHPADPPPPATAPVAAAAPLTIEDFRSLRRWLVVLGAIAVAALAVAIFAVSHADDAAERGRVAALERSVNRRLDQIDRRLSTQQSDIARADRRERVHFAGLDRRLRSVESNNVKAVKAAADTNRSLIALTRRVDTLAQQVNRRRR